MMSHWGVLNVLCQSFKVQMPTLYMTRDDDALGCAEIGMTLLLTAYSDFHDDGRDISLGASCMYDYVI